MPESRFKNNLPWTEEHEAFCYQHHIPPAAKSLWQWLIRQGEIASEIEPDLSEFNAWVAKVRIMKQTTLFDLEAFTKSPTPVYDPAWDEIETAPKQSHSVGGQIPESDIPYKSVGGQVTSNTLNTCTPANTEVIFDTYKSAPQHDTHWVEKYWVDRSGNKYWYFRYCWMNGRKIHRRYLGSVDSKIAKHKKADVEVWISDGQSPQEIEKLICSWRHP